jgi:hypothetical protein
VTSAGAQRIQQREPGPGKGSGERRTKLWQEEVADWVALIAVYRKVRTGHHCIGLLRSFRVEIERRRPARLNFDSE